MSFFRKLKDKLLRSSSKLDEGLDAIVEDGGVAEAAALPEPSDVVEPEPAIELEPEVVAEVAPKPIPEPSPAPIPEHIPEPVPEPVVEVKPDPIPEPAPPVPPKPAALEKIAPGPEPVAPPVEPKKAPPTARPVEALKDVNLLTDDAPDEPVAKPGLFGRLVGRKPAAPVKRRVLDDAMLEALEDLMITADLGLDTAMKISANLAQDHFGKKLSTQEIKSHLAHEVRRVLEPVAKPMPLYPKTPQVVLVVGVNGSGKTTTIGKLASQFKAAGKSVVIAAGDTFRAAAVEQLQVWGERAGVPVLTAPEGSDPASLAFDAMAQAEADGADLLMIDTAGRLQNRSDLMEELAKIVRVIRKRDPEAPHNTLLVLDATTGQNALSQVDIFTQIADVSGLVMTKLDGTAKGGVLVALAAKFGLPIHAIGVGEAIDDLAPFDPEDFAAALTGVDA